MRKIWVVVLALFLGGCMAWVKTPPREFVDHRAEFRALLPQGWMRSNLAPGFLITLDGTLLNVISVKRIQHKEKLGFTKKVFLADMAPLDMAEVEMDDLQAGSARLQVKVLENVPVSVDGHPAFKLVYEFAVENGMKAKGVVMGFSTSQYVYRIRFEAASEVYYAKTKAMFEAFLKDFHVLKK